MIDIRSAKHSGLPRPAATDRRTVDRLPRRGRRRAWAATIAAGPAATAKSAPQGAPAAPREREALLAWLTASTQELLDALREAGPDRGCWTWWGKSQSPQTCGAAARRQLHEIAVHTYDAQLTLGASQPLPDEAALDGVEEFLSTICTTTVAWPHEPAAVDYHATEGRPWRNWVSDDGARAARLPTAGTRDLGGAAFPEQGRAGRPRPGRRGGAGGARTTRAGGRCGGAAYGAKGVVSGLTATTRAEGLLPRVGRGDCLA